MNNSIKTLEMVSLNNKLYIDANLSIEELEERLEMYVRCWWGYAHPCAHVKCDLGYESY